MLVVLLVLVWIMVRRAYTPASGTNGRIFIKGTSTPLAGFYKWELKKSTKAVSFLHYESPEDVDGNFWQQQLVGGSEGDLTCEGYIDTNSSSATDSGSPGLRNGLVVTFSLIIFRGTPWGFNEVLAQITDYTVSSDITSDKPSPYKLTAKTTGIVGSSTTVTG
jgi:hypothetical protein